MISISLCMIVKNEEKVLARCLDSIKNAVDEIIIVDTGSSDNTKIIASKYTDHVYDFEWIDDFSAARNFSFSKATKDYIMWLDADDVIDEENQNKLIELKKQLTVAPAVMLKYNTAFDEEDKPTFTFFRERLIKRDCFISWKGRVHEVAQFSGKAIYADAQINHKSIKKEYSTRNLEIYEKQALQENDMSPRDRFYFARELYYHKKYDRAANMLTAFINDENAWVENKIEACKILSFCFLENEDIKNALTALFKTFSFDKPRCEICCLIGNIFMSQNNYKTAIFWFELALSLPSNDKNGGFDDLNSNGFTPCIQLCICYDKLGNYKKAEEYNRRAGQFRPKSSAYLHNLSYFDSLHTRGLL